MTLLFCSYTDIIKVLNLTQHYSTIQVALSSVIADQQKSLSASATPTGFTAFVVQSPGVAPYSNGTYGHPHNGTAPIIPSRPASQLVSWQSAFWAVATIALNTCLQDSGRTLETTKEFSLLARSSPLFCLADSLIIIGQFAFYTVKKGPKRALKIVASYRDQHPVQLEENVTKPLQFLTRILLALLALIQAVKLYAMQGVPITQVLGTCFLVSYILNAILNVLGKPTPELDTAEDAPPAPNDIVPKKRFTRVVARVCYALQILMWAIADKSALPAVLLNAPNTTQELCFAPVHILSVFLGIPFAFLWTVIFMYGPLFVDGLMFLAPVAAILGLMNFQPIRTLPTIASALGALLDVSAKTATIATGCIVGPILLLVRICKIKFSLFVLAFSDDLTERIFDVVSKVWLVIDPVMVMLFLILLSAAISYGFARLFFFGILADALHLRQFKIASNAGWAYLLLFVGNIGFGLLYYSQVYDPQNTYKPGWTSNLGKLMFR